MPIWKRDLSACSKHGYKKAESYLRGIGRATALTFAREGAKLVIDDMNVDGGSNPFI